MIKRSELLDQIEQVLKGNEAEICDNLRIAHLAVSRPPGSKTELFVTVKTPQYNKHFILRLVEPMS